MSITPEQFEQMRRRTEAAIGRLAQSVGESVQAEREVGRGGLHEQIIEHCNRQRPRWKFHHSRTDKRSTTEVGECDFTIFLPGGKVLCIEVKSKTGKLTEAQRDWAYEMNLIGHPVVVVRSMEEFERLTCP